MNRSAATRKARSIKAATKRWTPTGTVFPVVGRWRSVSLRRAPRPIPVVEMTYGICASTSQWRNHGTRSAPARHAPIRPRDVAIRYVARRCLAWLTDFPCILALIGSISLPFLAPGPTLVVLAGAVTP